MDSSFSPCNSTPHFHESSSGFPNHNLYKQQNNHGDGGGRTTTKKSAAAKLSTDRQSVAARERRHRISDRFKILQSLVPGGAKMDTVSMLEGAIHYVNFLKAQIWLHEAMINSVENCVVPDYYYDDPASSDYSQFLGDAAAIRDHEWLQANPGVAPPYPPSQVAFVEGGVPFQGEETMYYDESMYY